MTDPRTEGRAVLLGAAPGQPDARVLWAVGAFFAWHAGQLVRTWDRGLIVDSEDAGGTLSDGHRWRAIDANHRTATLSDGRRDVLTVRLADVARLVAADRLQPQLVHDVRVTVAERTQIAMEAMAASQAAITGQREPAAGRAARDARSRAVERRCEQLAAAAWQHVRPDHAPAEQLELFALAGGGR